MNRTIDIEAGVTFIFRDPEWWKKTLVASLLYFTIIGIIPVLGWGLEIQRRVIQDDQDEFSLPDWHDLEIYIINGIKLLITSWVWSLPAFLVGFGILISYVSMIFFIEENFRLIAIPLTISMTLFPIWMVLSLFLQTFYPLHSGLLIDDGSIRSALNFGRVFQLYRENFWQVIAAVFLSNIVLYFFLLMGSAFCSIGMALFSPIALGIRSHFYGQAYRNALIKETGE